MERMDKELGAHGEDSQAWLAAAYDEFGKPSFSLAVHILGDQDLAGDVVVQSFAHLWRLRHVCPWMDVDATVMRLTRHFAIYHLRLRRGRPITTLSPPSTALVAPGPTIGRVALGVRGGDLQKALRAVTAVQRRVIEASGFEDRSVAELAAELHLTEGETRAALRSGMRAIHDALAPRGADGHTGASYRATRGGIAEY